MTTRNTVFPRLVLLLTTSACDTDWFINDDIGIEPAELPCDGTTAATVTLSADVHRNVDLDSAREFMFEVELKEKDDWKGYDDANETIGHYGAYDIDSLGHGATITSRGQTLVSVGKAGSGSTSTYDRTATVSFTVTCQPVNADGVCPIKGWEGATDAEADNEYELYGYFRAEGKNGSDGENDPKTGKEADGVTGAHYGEVFELWTGIEHLVCNPELNACEETSWRKDSDGDGYGDDEEIVLACDAPDGYVADGGDCDDTDANVAEDCGGDEPEEEPTTQTVFASFGGEGAPTGDLVGGAYALPVLSGIGGESVGTAGLLVSGQWVMNWGGVLRAEGTTWSLTVDMSPVAAEGASGFGLVPTSSWLAAGAYLRLEALSATDEVLAATDLATLPTNAEDVAEGDAEVAALTLDAATAASSLRITTVGSTMIGFLGAYATLN